MLANKFKEMTDKIRKPPPWNHWLGSLMNPNQWLKPLVWGESDFHAISKFYHQITEKEMYIRKGWRSLHNITSEHHVPPNMMKKSTKYHLCGKLTKALIWSWSRGNNYTSSQWRHSAPQLAWTLPRKTRSWKTKKADWGLFHMEED